MTYQQVQRIVDGDAGLRAAVRDSRAPLRAHGRGWPSSCARRRYERGSLDFDLPEPKLVLDAAGQMTGHRRPSRAWTACAPSRSSCWPPTRRWRRSSPTRARPPSTASTSSRIPSASRSSRELVSSFGYRAARQASRRSGPRTSRPSCKQVEGKPEEKLVSYLLLRTMRLARYHEENLGHFGLATDMYAHFTSPIRRYPDLVVHRSLRALRHGRGDAGRT